MNKPIIGILPLADVKTGYAWMKPNYVSAVEDAGGIPFILLSVPVAASLYTLIGDDLHARRSAVQVEQVAEAEPEPDSAEEPTA